MSASSTVLTRRGPSFGLIALLVLGICPLAPAQILLGPPSDITIANGGKDVAVGDLDGDLELDLLVVPASPDLFGGGTYRYTTVKGVGDGTFSTLLTANAGFDISFIGLGELIDVDDDGHLDWVAAANRSGGPFPAGGVMGVWPGNGGLLFGSPDFLGLQQLSSSQALVADLTADSELDVVLIGDGSFGPSELDVFVADDQAPGGFDEIAAANVTNGFHYAALGHFNADAFLDLALTTTQVGQTTGSLEVHLATSATSWAAGVTYAAGVLPLDLAAVDADEDGLVDLLVVDGDDTTGQLSFLKGDGNGGFDAPIAVSVAGDPQRLLVEDLDADGHLDVVLSHPLPGVLSVLRGAGDGSFSLIQTLSNQNSARGMDAGDFDGDGDLDLAVMRSIFPIGGPGQLSIVINETYQPASPFTDLGQSLAGTNGFPIQIVSGQATPGTPTSFDLHNALPGGVAFFVLGGVAANLPFEGGTMVPLPEIIMGPYGIDGNGHSLLAGNWPNDIPSGVQLFGQWFFADAGALVDYAGSNAVRIDVP